tara:strand:+ start:2714 stop:4210 length:1497 start_codon:yes stop_codon:yes gene_type:complete
MKPIVYNGHYIVNKDQMDFKQPVEIHFTRFGDTPRPCKKNCLIGFDSSDSFKVFCNFNEPTSSENTETTENVIKYHRHYDLIITSRDEIVQQCDNAVFFPYGSTWLYKDLDHKDGIGFYHPSIDKLHKNKKDNISFLMTNHRNKEGYEIRHEIWNKQNQIHNKLFYSSTRNPISPDTLPNDDKRELFKSKFSIVIESSKEENYFTEKICDALISKTIPIYWGCPNIDDFFDTRGMIICETADEVLEACKKVDQNFGLYDEMKKYVDDNFEKAKKYCESLSKRIEKEIKDKLVPKEKKDIILSVGVLTLTGREHFLNRLMNKFKSIIGENAHRVEIVISHDNKEKTVGEKRNEVLQKAEGKYICFVDDDDMVSDNYFNWIIQILDEHSDADGVGFKGIYYQSGNPVMEFSHSSGHQGHFKIQDPDGKIIQQRPLNHLNPVRADIVKQIGFPEKSFGEDSDYCDKLYESNLLKKEIFLDKILYHYLYDPTTSQTQNGTIG